jgi:hypothetical protein
MAGVSAAQGEAHCREESVAHHARLSEWHPAPLEGQLPLRPPAAVAVRTGFHLDRDATPRLALQAYSLAPMIRRAAAVVVTVVAAEAVVAVVAVVVVAVVAVVVVVVVVVVAVVVVAEEPKWVAHHCLTGILQSSGRTSVDRPDWIRY